MTAQPSEVLRAYAFVVWHRGKKSHVSGVVANDYAAALAQMQSRYGDLQKHGELELLNCASALMQPAHIFRWDDEQVMGTGSFVFLEGMFFGEYQGQRIVTSCRKVKTTNGWWAIVYGGDYEVRPL